MAKKPARKKVPAGDGMGLFNQAGGGDPFLRLTPSQQLESVLKGKTPWKDAPQSIQSWAQLHIYNAALRIIALPDIESRQTALGPLPDDLRGLIESEIKRQWALAKA